jgi:hypothetical protein
MGPRKQSKAETVEHQSPIYLKHVSNFKASLRRRDSARFLRTKVNIKRFTGLLHMYLHACWHANDYVQKCTQENDKSLCGLCGFLRHLKEVWDLLLFSIPNSLRETQ